VTPAHGVASTVQIVEFRTGSADRGERAVVHIDGEYTGAPATPNGPFVHELAYGYSFLGD